MKIGAIVQARFSSSRLPGKILKELPYASGITALTQVIRRLKKAEKLDEIIVALAIEKDNCNIINIAKKERVMYFEGSNKDVLSRYYLSALENKLDIIVRISSDCPCIDPKIVDSVIEKHIEKNADYTSNTLERTFPRGFDTEVVNFDVLEKAYKKADSFYEREHVTPYIYRKGSKFKIIQVKASKKLSAPDIRITLDTNEDYALLCLVFDTLYRKDKYFNAREIIKLFRKKPWLKLINKAILQK